MRVILVLHRRGLSVSAIAARMGHDLSVLTFSSVSAEVICFMPFTVAKPRLGIKVDYYGPGNSISVSPKGRR